MVVLLVVSNAGDVLLALLLDAELIIICSFGVLDDGISAVDSETVVVSAGSVSNSISVSGSSTLIVQFSCVEI